MTEPELESLTLNIPYSLKSRLAAKGKASGIKDYKRYLELVIEQAVKDGFVLDVEPSYQTRLHFNENVKKEIKNLVQESKTVRERWLLAVLEEAVKD